MKLHRSVRLVEPRAVGVPEGVPPYPVRQADQFGYVIELVRLPYANFGPSLASEVLLAKDGFKVSRETLRKWIVDGLWLSRKRRGSFHRPWLRPESYG